MNQFITWLSRAEELAASHPPLKADLIALKEEEIAHTVGDCEVIRSLVVGIGPVHTKTIVKLTQTLVNAYISVHTKTIIVYVAFSPVNTKTLHFGERFRIYAFTVSVFIVFVWTEGLNA